MAQDINHGWVKLGDGTLTHNSTAATRISKTYINLFDVGQSYVVKITITDYISGTIKILVGSQESSEFTGNGVKEFGFTATTSSPNIILESNGLLNVEEFNVYSIEVNLISVDYTDDELFENKSFTVSYDPINENWISYHSYIPNNYFQHPTKYLKDVDGVISISNSDEYQSDMPFIIETVFNDHPDVTKVNDNIIVNLESYYEGVTDNDFFDELLVYNEQQSSGVITLDEDTVTKKEKNWNIHKLLDISTNTASKKLFSIDWEDIKSQYPIDKVVNSNAIDESKDWWLRGRFRDKYFVVRFTFKNLVNKKLLCNFVTSSYRVSQR